MKQLCLARSKLVDVGIPHPLHCIWLYLYANCSVSSIFHIAVCLLLLTLVHDRRFHVLFIYLTNHAYCLYLMDSIQCKKTIFYVF